MSVKVESRPVEFLNVSISSGATISSAFEVPGKIVGLHVPSTSSSTAFYFHSATSSSGTFARLRSRGNNALTITATASTATRYALPPADFASVRFGKLERSTAQTPSAITYVVAYIR